MPELRLPEIIRDGLLSALDSRTVNQLLTTRPDLAETVAIAIGKARLWAGMTITPVAAFAFSQLVEAGVADADSFALGTPRDFDLDATLRSIRELISDLMREPR